MTTGTATGGAATWPLVLSILQEIRAPRLAELTGYARSAVYDVLRGATPRAGHALGYTRIAVGFARERLEAWRAETPDATTATLTRYLAEREARGQAARRCEWCGLLLSPGRRHDTRFCSDRCRSAAQRARFAQPSG